MPKQSNSAPAPVAAEPAANQKSAVELIHEKLLQNAKAIIENFRGDNTPAEEFAYAVLTCYNPKKQFTPEDARAWLEHFEECYKDWLEESQNLLRAYGYEIHPPKQEPAAVEEEPAAAAAPATAESELPDWAMMPSAYEYSLIIRRWGGDGEFEEGTAEDVEDVEMTRAEYITLKRQLAEMRGYELPVRRHT